jgi:iron(III) transport system permease protein
MPSFARRLRPAGGFALFAAVVSATMTVLILYPLVHVAGVVFFPGGRFDPAPILAALNEAGLLSLLRNTVLLVLGSTALAVATGSVFAWLTERTDLGMAWLTRVLPIVPLLVPPIAGSIGWVLLAAPRSGFLNVLLRFLLAPFGLEPSEGPLTVFSWPGLIYVYVLYLVPEAYLVVCAGLRNIDPALEEAARMSGSNPWRTLIRITLPSVKPAIAAGAMLSLLTGFALFSVPVIIGPQAGIPILSVRVVELMTATYPPKTGTALTLGLVVLIVTGMAWWLQSRLLRGNRYAMIAGRGMRVTAVRLGRWRLPARAVMIAFMLMTSVLPFAALVVVSLQPFWTAVIRPSSFTLRNYTRLFVTDFSRNALLNSVLLGIVGATLGVMFGAVIAFYLDRSRSRWIARFVDGVTKLPGAVSHLIIGIAFVGSFAGPPFSLAGTMVLLLLAYLVICTPQATFSASAALAQVGRELSEASLMSGATTGRTFVRVVLPLMRPGLAAAWVLLFVMMSGEITASSMLAGTGNPVVGFVVLDLWTNGSYAALAAFGTLMSLITSTVVLGMLAVTRRS